MTASAAVAPQHSSAQPSWLHYLAACGTLYVGLQLLFCYVDLAIVDRDPIVIFGVLFLIPLLGPLLWQQYRGTFLGMERGATLACRLLYGLGCFMLLGYVANVVEGVQKHGASPTQAMFNVWELAAAALLPLAAGRSNQLRARALRKAHAEEPTEQLPSTTTSRRRLGAIALLSLVLAVTAYQHYVRGPRYAEHIARSAAPFTLPAGATDVCYARGYRNTTAFEFTIDEASFRDWVTQHFETSGTPHRQLAEIKDVMQHHDGCIISRYASMVPDRANEREAKVLDGLCFQRHFEDQRRQAVYDRANRRAYFSGYYY